MKNISLLPLLGLWLLTGCASHYVITLSNGQRVDAAGKPRLEQGYYRFKTSSGQEARVPAMRVREIAPASMSEDPGKTIKPYTVK